MMGVRKKGRRKIRCSDKDFVWFVKLDDDSPDYILNIVAEDKTLILTCPLHMENPYIISKGAVFQNQAMNGVASLVTMVTSHMYVYMLLKVLLSD